MKLLISIASIVTLVGCQTHTKEANSHPCVQTPSTLGFQEIFDVSIGEEMVQIDSQEMNNGYMYTFTNNGTSHYDKDIDKKTIVVELNGEQEPHRLKNIFPEYCSEISYSDKIINNYRTWLDILSCPYYEDPSSSKGLLVINKSIQGTDKFYGATLYKTIPAYNKSNLKDYRDLALSEAEIQDIDRFIDETAILKEELPTDGPNTERLSKIAALSLSTRYIAVEQLCKHTVSDIYLKSLVLTSDTDAESDWYSKALKAQVAEYKNRIERKQKESSLEEACQFYSNLINDDVKAHLSRLYSKKSTSSIQDEGLIQITSALQSKDACGYKVTFNDKFNDAHNLDTSDFSEGGKHQPMFFYYGIQAGVDMNKVGRFKWCEEVKASNQLLAR